MRAVPLVAGLISAGACGTANVGDPPDVGDDDATTAAVDAAAAVDASPPDALVCAGGDARVTDPVSGHCYIYSGTLGTRAEGAVACLALGGHLATATSAAEVAILTGLPTMPAAVPDAWLGGGDLAVEGLWVWDTAEVMTYSNWRTGEPNNGGAGGVEESCMVLESDTMGSWDDRPCSGSYPALCELP